MRGAATTNRNTPFPTPQPPYHPQGGLIGIYKREREIRERERREREERDKREREEREREKRERR